MEFKSETRKLKSDSKTRNRYCYGCDNAKRRYSGANERFYDTRAGAVGSLFHGRAQQKLIDLAAFIDRVERANGEEDFRMGAFRAALTELNGATKDKAKQVLLTFNDPTTEPIPRRGRKRRRRSVAWPRELALTPLTLLTPHLMRYIEPHAHMVSRVTDDYVKMTLAGCAAVCEPAFWAGFDRSSGGWLFTIIFAS